MKRSSRIFLNISKLLFTILFFWWANHESNKRDREIEKVGLEDLNLQLVGVINTVIRGGNYHGRGIIRLRIISSNISEYDPRGKQPYYFCVIKNGIAEMYDHTPVPANSFKKDTVIYDTRSKMGGYLHNGLKVDYVSISINSDEGYYEFIKEKTMFK